MKTIIDLYFKTSEGKVVGRLRKTFKTDFIPILNAFIEDGVWAEPKKIIEITINPTEGYYFIKVDEVILESVESFNEIIKSYEKHNWEK